MGRLVVLDASVVIALLAPEDAHHVAATAALEARLTDDLIMPASAYAETLVRPHRHSARAAAKAEAAVADLAIRIVPVDSNIARRAARLRARKQALTLGDALVLGTGDELDAVEVLTADDEWPKVSRRARII